MTVPGRTGHGRASGTPTDRHSFSHPSETWGDSHSRVDVGPRDESLFLILPRFLPSGPRVPGRLRKLTTFQRLLMPVTEPSGTSGPGKTDTFHIRCLLWVVGVEGRTTWSRYLDKVKRTLVSSEPSVPVRVRRTYPREPCLWTSPCRDGSERVQSTPRTRVRFPGSTWSLRS